MWPVGRSSVLHAVKLQPVQSRQLTVVVLSQNIFNSFCFHKPPDRSTTRLNPVSEAFEFPRICKSDLKPRPFVPVLPQGDTAQSQDKPRSVPAETDHF
jgi:hypothetical protein